MDSEKETAEESNKQEGKKGSTEVKEKEQITEDAGDGEGGKVEEMEAIEEKKQEIEKAEENEETKEEEGNAGQEEEVKGEEEEEKGEQEDEEVEEGKSGEDEEDDGKEEEEETTEKKSVTKGSKKEKTSERGELLSPRTPVSDRPTRERKTVERFTVNATARGSAAKPLAIEKGQGTLLKDIPNVAFKLSKRKADENLHLLHTILFGKKAKVHNLKKNISLFSGFVWIENEEKQRAKVKEKLDKCVKEKLLDFCDVLNIPVNKASVKKEELSAKLLEFLESPYATTDILLADKEKGKRRRSNDPTIKSPGSSNVAGGKHTKKQKLDSESGKKRKHSADEKDNDESEPSQSEDDQDDDNKVTGAESDEKENDSEEETDEDQRVSKTEIVVKTGSSKRSTKKDTGGNSEKSKSVDKKSPVKASKAPGKSTKNSSSSASKKGASDSESKSKKKALSTKKPKIEKESEMDTSAPPKAKASSKSSTKVLKKDRGEGKSSKKGKKEPSKEEMHAVVVDILKEVDFNTATLSDILRQLGEHFGIDLLHRKSEVKDIITEVIKNMSDDEDEEASEDESGKDGGDDDA